MDDTDDRRVRSSRNSSVFDLQQSRNAFQSQHSFGLECTTAHDHEALVQAAMQEAAQHPDRHRMAVLPSKTKSSVQLIDVKHLTTSKKQLVLSRAMETGGQDNERLLTKIRERQDRCELERYVSCTTYACPLTNSGITLHTLMYLLRSLHSWTKSIRS